MFAPVLRESTPLLYLSAMPQTPSSSPLCKLWVEHLQKHVSVTSGHPASWPAEVHTLHGHTHYVNSVAYSPDGTHIVSGSWDKTIRVWNATTGQSVAGPFQGHTYGVISVAYSPNGIHIASGSWDNTIRIWNATTGQFVTGPFQGHTCGVISVAYSPDGTHIVSGSDDKTIRVWNATTGQSVAGSFQRHTGWINSVACSPDGNHIVTGSSDCSIKVWRADLYKQNSQIQSSSGTSFGWMAPHNGNTFHLPIHSLVISSDRISTVDIDTSLFGESWTSSWI